MELLEILVLITGVIGIPVTVWGCWKLILGGWRRIRPTSHLVVELPYPAEGAFPCFLRISNPSQQTGPVEISGRSEDGTEISVPLGKIPEMPGDVLDAVSQTSLISIDDLADLGIKTPGLLKVTGKFPDIRVDVYKLSSDGTDFRKI